MGNIGKNGKNITAPAAENILPKLELIPIIIYFIVLPNTFRPSMTPSCNTAKSFWVRIMSAASLATSTPLLTAIPTSAALSEGASLMPSPK